MTHLALHVIFRSGREARVRLLATATGIAVSTCLLLVILAALNGMSARDERRAWMESSASNSAPSIDESLTDPMLMLVSYDYIGEQPIVRVSVAALGSDAPVPPGIARIPEPGEYYLSPALAHLVGETDPSELGNRFPGHQIGTVGDNALTTPDMLLVIQGAEPTELRANSSDVEIRSFETHAEPYSLAIRVLLAIGGLGLIFPVVVFIGTATRLSAASREQRFAAMRLVGATPRQVSRIAMLEALIGGVFGLLVGGGMFMLVQPLLDDVPMFGGTFFADDLTLSPVVVVVIALVLIALIMCSALLALRRLQVSPLGVRQHARTRPPRLWGLVPLGLGLAAMGVPAIGGMGASLGTAGMNLAVLGGFLFTLVGMVMIGPWLTWTESRVLIRLASGAQTLIAGRRLANAPAAAARATSGLALAVFVVSVFAGLSSAVSDGASAAGQGGFPDDAVGVSYVRSPLAVGEVQPLIEQLRGLEGVTAVVSVYGSVSMPDNSLVSCADTGALGVGSCGDQAGDMAVLPRLVILSGSTIEQQIWPTVSAPEDRRVQGMLVRTDGTPATIARVQTSVIAFHPFGAMPLTRVQFAELPRPVVAELERLAYGGMIASMAVAACSMAVSTIAGILERKRAFGLLRLAGMPLRTLQQAILLEAAAPMLVATVISAGMGLVVADVLLRLLLSRGLSAPGAPYFILVGVGIVIAVGILLLTLPMVRRVTSTDTVRYE